MTTTVSPTPHASLESFKTWHSPIKRWRRFLLLNQMGLCDNFSQLNITKVMLCDFLDEVIKFCVHFYLVLWESSHHVR